MKKLFWIFSLSMLLFSTFVPSFTYANTESEDEAVNILTEELNNTMAVTSITNNTLINGENNTIELAQENKSENSTAVFLTWIDFIYKIKKLANNSIANWYTADTQITKIERTNNLVEWLNENNIVSSENSEKFIYAWFDNWVIYIYSDAKKIYLPEDSSYMFYYLKNLETINLKEFDASRVKKMYQTFYRVWLESIDFSKMNFENVENVEYMFQNCQNLKYINLSEAIFSWLQNMSQWIFRDRWTLVDVNLSWADFRNLKSMSYMFWYNYNLKNVDFTNANFWSATTADCMFVWASKLENVSFRNTKLWKLNNVQWMFMEWAKNVDFSFADLSSLENASRSDSFIPGNIENINFEWTDLSKIKSMKYWFQSKNNLKNLNLSWTILTSLEDMSYMFQSNNWITWIDFTHTDLSNVKTMEKMFSSAYAIKYVNFSWSNLENLENTNEMFNYSVSLTGVNFHWADLHFVTDSQYMFQSTSNLKEIDFSSAKMWSMKYIINWSNVEKVNFSWANFENVESMEKAFYNNTKLLKIDFTNIEWANNVRSMESMFYSDTALTWIDLSNFDLSSVKNMYWMFQSDVNLRTINFWKSKIKPEWSLHSMFESNEQLTNLDFSNFDTSEITDMSYMFYGNNWYRELDLWNLDTANVTNMEWMFNNNKNLERIYVSDKFITWNVTQWERMFSNDESLIWWNWTRYNPEKKNAEYARIDSENISWYFTNIIDKEYNIKYVIDPEYIIWWTNNMWSYTPRSWAEFKRASKPWYELEFWHESWYNIPFEINESTRGDKTLYPKWKAIEEKAQEIVTENVVYTNETTVTIWDDIQEEPINNSSLINLVSKEVETEEVKAEEEKITVKESEIKVTSDKTVEYEWWLEVYLEKTENEVTEKVEGTIKFSSPVAVKIPITSNAETVKVQVKHEWEEFGYKWLTINPVNNCSNWEAVNDKYNWENITVKDVNWEKYALIYTCSASTFVAYTENTKPTNNTTSVSSPAAWWGRIVTSTKNENNISEQEHNSADTENKSVKQNTTTQTKEVVIDSKLKQRSLTRWEVAVMTNILLEVFPQLVEWKQELNDVENACSNYADEQNFTKAEKKAITRLCKLSIMWIHADNNKPLDEFMVNQNATNDEFSKVINRSISTYNEKDLSTVKDALKKLEKNEENVEFWTLYWMFMWIKELLN